MNTIVSAFPGTGKSYICGTSEKYLDSDSSKFDKSNFPTNYVDYIETQSENNLIHFVSSHKEVRDELRKRNIPFMCVIPKVENKEEYLQRYKDRGNAVGFIELVNNNWDNWIEDIIQNESYVIQLEKGKFISDVITQIFYMNEKIKYMSYTEY